MQVVGFSGTNDNRSLLPLQVQAQDTADASIKGTNGRMVHLLLQRGKCTFAQLTGSGSQGQSSAKRVICLALQSGASAIIDAGMYAQ